MSKDPRLPLAPLERIARARADLPSSGSSREGSGNWFNDHVFSQMCGVSSRAICRWRETASDSYPGGEVPWRSADLAATRLGLHPLDIWGEAWMALDHDVINGENKRVLAAIEKDMERVGAIMAAGAVHPEPSDEFAERRRHMEMFPELYHPQAAKALT